VRGKALRMITGVEIKRKIVHLATVSIPIGYGMLPKETVITVLLPLFFGFLLVDLLRHYHSGMTSFFQKYFLGTVLREKERSTLMGATYFLFSSILVILFFPKSIAIVSLLILILSDTAAALVGKAIGKVRIFEKTLEGSLAFLVCSLLIVWVYPELNRFWGSLAALAATLIELLPIRVDDNITIPLAAGGIMFFGAG
jgi:dolichol kinase